MNAVTRKFEATPAQRKAVGLLLGLVGPSGSGKTFSALLLAEGIRRICGGEIDLIDTENKRALYYADRFKFHHVPFDAPFSPDDYLAVIEYCVKRGTKTIIVDSGSHEHEGPGGVLEWHEEETQRLATAWKTSPEKAQIAAWGPPKKARRNLINKVLQMNVNIIFTFRAKEKIKVLGGGKPPLPLGWQPICGEEWLYEFALQALLLPGSEGRPTWNSDLESERAIMKLPAQFADIFDRNKPAQLSADIGERLAKWAAGDLPVEAPPQSEIEARINSMDTTQLEKLTKAFGDAWKSTKHQPTLDKYKATYEAMKAQIAEATKKETQP